MISCYIKYGSNYIDVSDYVTGFDGIPKVIRNRDWSVPVATMRVSLADTVNPLIGDVAPALNSIIKFVVNTTDVFFGIINARPYNYDACEYEITVTELLSVLRTKNIDYTTLHSAFAAATPGVGTYRPISYNNGATVNILFAFRMMFDIAGLTLDTSAVENLVVKASHQFLFYSSTVTKEIKLSDLYTLEEALYNLKRSNVGYHTQIAIEPQEGCNFFEFLSEVCRWFKISIQMVSEGSYKLITEQEFPEIANEDIYEITEEEVFAEYDVNEVNIAFTHSTNTNNYLMYDLVSPETIKLNTGGHTISMIDNLIFMFEHELVALESNYYVITNAVDRLSNLCFTDISASGHWLFENDYVVLRGIAGCGKLCVSNNIEDRGSDAVRVVDADTNTGAFVVDSQGAGNTYIEGGWAIKCTDAQGLRRDKWQYSYLLPSENQISLLTSNYIHKEFKTNLLMDEVTVLSNKIDSDECSNIVLEEY